MRPTGALRDALAWHRPGADERLRLAFGERLGSAAMQTHARLANVNKPQLHTHDRFGRRIDEVEFHPSYHVLLGAAVDAGAARDAMVARAGRAHRARRRAS